MFWRGIFQCVIIVRKSVDEYFLPPSISCNSSVALQNSILSIEASKMTFSSARLVVLKIENNPSVKY